PAATVDNEVLVGAARRALDRMGLALKLSAGSTDANIAMAQGMSAAAFGVYRGGNAHRLEEWVDPESLAVGLQALRLLLEELVTSRACLARGAGSADAHTLAPGGERQRVDQFVLRVSGVTFRPTPRHFMLRLQLQESFPQVLVLDSLAPRRPPPIGLP